MTHGGNDGSTGFGDMPPIITAAHELKSPLALIRQLSLELEQMDHDEPTRQRLFSQISLTSEKALRLTSDLTRAFRLDDALFKLEPINPLVVCEDVVQQLRQLFDAHGRGLRIRRIRGVPLVVAHRDLLSRIIMNFCDNALHYSQGQSPVEMSIATMRGSQTVRLGVRDYGPRVASDVFRGGHALASRPHSSGLGLYIVSRFADAMNARVGVVRHRDGSTFYIDINISHQMKLL